MDLPNALAAAATVVLLAGAAAAQPSPECVNPVAADPSVQYPAFEYNAIRFCAPTLDVDGQPLVEDELIGVRIYVNGNQVDEMDVTPGLYLEVPVSPSWPKFGTLILESYGPGARDDRSQTPLYQARFRRSGPAKPNVR